MQGVVGFLINTLLQFTVQSSSQNFFLNSVKIWQNYSHEFAASFLAHHVVWKSYTILAAVIFPTINVYNNDEKHIQSSHCRS